MGLTRVSGPAREPVSLTEALLQIRSDGTDEEQLINLIIQSSRELSERTMGRQLITAQWKYTLEDFPEDGRIKLPRAPLQSVESVKYLDMNGVQQTLSTSIYRVVKDEEPGYLVEAPYQIWPLVLCQPGAVEVNYTAGFGDNPEDVPAGIRQRLLILIGDGYENRESVVVGQNVNSIPLANQLFWAYRVLEVA